MAIGSYGIKPRRWLRHWGRSRVGGAGLVALAIGALVAATAIYGGSANHAAAQMLSGLDALETCAVSRDIPAEALESTPSVWDVGANAMSANWPAVLAYSRAPAPYSGWAESPAREVYVWSTFMTVGTATDGTTTYTGYIPDAGLGSPGSLDHASFIYDGMAYTVQGIYHQVNREMHQVVFVADKRLPEHLAFYAGNDQFRVSESLALDADENTHVWRVDASPGWSENQRVLVTLLEEHGGLPLSGPMCE